MTTKNALSPGETMLSQPPVGEWLATSGAVKAGVPGQGAEIGSGAASSCGIGAVIPCYAVAAGTAR